MLQAPRPSPPGKLRSLIGGCVGNLVEWYDWYVYAAFALYFAQSFFPQGDGTAQLLNVAAVFAVGFLMRPIGGWMLGRYADRHGRRAALTLSVLLMCAGSLMIAITPSYASIGVAAPVLLVLARLLQGLSVGGEYAASATYLSELAGARRRGFIASFQYVTLIAGQLIALAVLLILQNSMSEAALESWGWRIPFVIGALCAAVAMFLRRGILETDSFVAIPLAERRGTLRGLLAYPRELLFVLGLTMGGSLAFYTFTTYVQKFLVNTAGWTKAAATELATLSLVCFLFLQPLFGALSDRFGRRPQLIAFGILGVLGTVPLMHALARVQSFPQAFLLVMCALTVLSCYTSIGGLFKAELFPANVRALGVGISHAIGVSLFGGTAEFIALWLKSIGHESWFYVYVSACIGVALLVAMVMPDPRTHSRIVD